MYAVLVLAKDGTLKTYRRVDYTSIRC